MRKLLIISLLLLTSWLHGQITTNVWYSTSAPVDNTAPIAQSFELGTYSDSIIIGLFDESLDSDSVPSETAFSFTAGVDVIGLDSAWSNADSLFIGLDSALTVYNDSTLLMDYTQAHPYLQDVSENAVASWTDSTVANNLGGTPSILASDSVKIWLIGGSSNWTLDPDSISQWDDVSGYNHHFTESTGAERPIADGDTVVFDGIDDELFDYLPENMIQPITVFALLNIETWNGGDAILRFNGSTAHFSQDATGSSPDVYLRAGTSLTGESNLTLNEWHVVTLELNGTNSSIQVDDNAAITGDAGTSAGRNFVISDQGAQMRIHEFIVINDSLSTSEKTSVYNYLNAKK